MPALTDALYALAAIVSSPFWGYRLCRTGKWRTDWPARFGRCELPPDERSDRRTLLIHAVSVGEVNAIRQLVERLDQAAGDRLRIVIATTTDTGTARARQLFEPRHPVVRFPLDFTRSVRRFLDAVRPDAVALVELEVWPNFVAECGRRGIPVNVINGRLSDRSFRGYRLIRPLLARTFARLDRIAVQDEDYAGRFAALGADPQRVEIAGNMKWDTTSIADDMSGSDDLARALGIDPERPLIVCGSTGPGEEAMLVRHLADLTAPAPSRNGERRPVQLLIAPRKPERFDEAAEAMGHPVRRTQHPDGANPPEPDANRSLFLLDTLGELGKAYALADLVVIGRSFCGLYGSDMTEPIALGKPTLIGPETADFREMVRLFLAGRGLIQVETLDELRKAAAELLADPVRATEFAERGREVIRSQQGATDRHARLLLRSLSIPTDQPAHGSRP